jgi:hypothetical protein
LTGVHLAEAWWVTSSTGGDRNHNESLPVHPELILAPILCLFNCGAYAKPRNLIKTAVRYYCEAFVLSAPRTKNLIFHPLRTPQVVLMATYRS